MPLLLATDTGETPLKTDHGARGREPVWWIARSPVVVLALLVSGCVGSESPDPRVETSVRLEPELAIFGGAPDDDYASVSSVVALKVGTVGAYELCSGVLLSPNVVLTARHCIANSVSSGVSCSEKGESTNGVHVDGEQPPESVAVYTGAAPKFSNKADAVGRAIVAPKSQYLCDTDIALVVLDHPIANVEPVAVRLGGGVAAGETIRSVGYGQNDKRVPFGTRLRKNNVSVLATGRGISPSKTALGAHEFEVGRSICQGDSGGPALSEDTGAVVGVVSRGGECDDDFGHIYTTTNGWAGLFDEAFAIAGGAPIVESGQPAGTETAPRAAPISPPTVAPPARAEASCSSAGAASPSSSSFLVAMAGVFAASLCRKRTTRPSSKAR